MQLKTWNVRHKIYPWKARTRKGTRSANSNHPVHRPPVLESARPHRGQCTACISAVPPASSSRDDFWLEQIFFSLDEFHSNKEFAVATHWSPPKWYERASTSRGFADDVYFPFTDIWIAIIRIPLACICTVFQRFLVHPVVRTYQWLWIKTLLKWTFH